MATDDEAAPGLAAPQQSGVEDVPGPLDADADDAGHDTRALFVDASLGQNPTELRNIIKALEQDADLTTVRLYVVAGSQGITGWRRAHQAAGLSSEWVEVPRFPPVSSRSGIATRMLLDVIGLFRDSRTAVDSVALMTADPNLAYLAQWIRREYGVGVLGVSTREVHEALEKACNVFIRFGDSPADSTSSDSAALSDTVAQDDTRWVESVRKAVAEVSSRRGERNGSRITSSEAYSGAMASTTRPTSAVSATTLSVASGSTSKSMSAAGKPAHRACTISR